MYKDKDRQREATKAAVKRYRAKQGITQAAVEQGITSGITQPPEVINGKYNREYLPGGQYYVGCCYQDGDGNWQVRASAQRTSHARLADVQAQAISGTGATSKASQRATQSRTSLYRRLYE